MNTADYWKQREVRLRKTLLDRTIAETETELSIEYKKTAKEIVAKIESLYNEILSTGDVSVNKLYQYNKYYQLLANINTELKRLGKHEYKILNHKFNKLYSQNERQLNQQFGLSDTINEDIAIKVIDAYWAPDKLNWSDRIWNNKSLLTEKLRRGLFDAVATGKSTDALVKDLMTSFNQSYSNAKRLVVTELNRILIDNTVEKYKEAGIKKYIFLTARDEKVCEICGALDGKEFPITDKKHLPPQHPNCRCTILGKIE